jgi:hypothetical protein
MPDKITKLNVVSDELIVHEEVVKLLRDALAAAERGEIVEIAMICMLPGDDEWHEAASATTHHSSWIGKLEILKSSWIAQYVELHE